MSAPDIETLTREIGICLRRNRSAIMQEATLQDGIAIALSDLGIEFEREHRLDAHGRLDFWLPAHGWLVEVKKRNVNLSVLPQLSRYFAHAKVKGAILIATRIHKVPPVFAGKPIAQIPLWKHLL